MTAPYKDPDLTGSDLGYYEDNLLRTVIRPSQKIIFDGPIFDNSNLEVFRVSTNLIPMVRNVDYIIDVNEDIDYDFMSRMRTLSSAFDAVLLKSITVVRNYSEDYIILLRFNRLFPVAYTYSNIHEGEELQEVTPQLISSIIADLNFTKNLLIKEITEFTDTSLDNLLLDKDPLKENPLNIISNEVHTLNTLIGKKIIKPVYGSFFKDSIQVRNLSTSEYFIEGTDFICIGIDIPKTKRTPNVHGVFKYVEMLTDFVGDVSIGYHAFGEEVTLANVKKMDQRLQSISQYLNNAEILTPHTLNIHPMMGRINNKISELEGQMRILLNSGIPSYGDVTSGMAIRKQITSVNDDLHFWTIASLFKVAGSEDIVMADSMKLKIQTLNTGLQFECSVYFNAVNPDNPFSVKVLNGNIFKDTFANVFPHIRVVYNRENEEYSGVLLQIGMKLKDILTEVIAVEDISGKESCWRLIAAPTVAAGPEDNNLILPNVSIYRDGEPFNVSHTTIIPMSSGYNLYNGAPVAISLTEPNAIECIVPAVGLPTVKSVTVVFNITASPSVMYKINIPVTFSDKIIGSGRIQIEGALLDISISQSIGMHGVMHVSKVDSGHPNVALSMLEYIINF